MDHFKTLGVDRNATPDEIKKAYRRLAGQHHPDRGGDTATFQKIEEAYRILSDPQKRQEYENPFNRPGGFGPGPGPFGGGGFGPGGFSFNVNGFDMNDLFGQMFGHHQQRQQQPQMFRTVVIVDLEQVYNGAEQTLQLQTPKGNHVITIKVPKGIPDGGQVRFDNMIDGASLLVEFRIRPHLKFERNGNDLYCNQQVSVLDLIVGGDFEFTTISGKTFTVTVPENTQPHMQLKIAGQGMPIPNTNLYGDQIILIKPFVPDRIDTAIKNSILQSKNK